MIWTKEQDKKLKDLYKKHIANDCAKMLGVSRSVVKNRIHKLGLKKSVNSGQFKKGVQVWNKGLKGIHLSPKSEFKKGNIPANHREVGSMRTSRDGYIEIKTGEPNRWDYLQRVIWEEHHGEIPTEHIVIFKDGDRSNLEISNLKCINRKEHAASARKQDGFIAFQMSRKDKELRKELVKHPELIELQRKLNELNKALENE